MLLMHFFFFFFSSRRRHTRSKRDWSSDVCSSDLVKSGDFVVAAPDQVSAFLTSQQADFDIGRQPVEHYVATKNVQVNPAIVTEIKNMQRVLQIAPSKQAMGGLLKRKINAAYHVVRFDEQTFTDNFAQDLGGSD